MEKMHHVDETSHILSINKLKLTKGVRSGNLHSCAGDENSLPTTHDADILLHVQDIVSFLVLSTPKMTASTPWVPWPHATKLAMCLSSGPTTKSSYTTFHP